MSFNFPDPVSLGTVARERLDRVRELHGVVREWIEASARAQKSPNNLANLPYVDLMLAFGFATLGDHDTAQALVEAARKVMAVPIPGGGTLVADQAVTAAVVSNVLFAVFEFRVQEALAGNRHDGPLSPRVLGEYGEIVRRGGHGPVNNPYKMALVGIDRVRDISRIAEPTERVDQFGEWTKHGDATKRELVELRGIREPAALAARLRGLLTRAANGPSPERILFEVLSEGLPLAARVGEALVLEFLDQVPAALAADPKHHSFRWTQLLEDSLALAVQVGRGEIVVRLVRAVLSATRNSDEAVRLKRLGAGAAVCLRSLRKVGLTDEIDRFMAAVHDELGGSTLANIRQRHAHKPDIWAAALGALLTLSAGGYALGRAEGTIPVLDVVREALLGPEAERVQSFDYTHLVQRYVDAIADTPEGAFPRLFELFKGMNPKTVTNTWTTAQYHSRFHLQIIEATVSAVCRVCLDNPVPVIV
jgi:cellulose synthase operon protein C